jgi:hypothetical protein
MFNVLHGLHSHDSPTSTLEQSFRQANLNGRSSKTLDNNLQKKKLNQLVLEKYLQVQ